MIERIEALSDRIVSYFVPKLQASACCGRGWVEIRCGGCNPAGGGVWKEQRQCGTNCDCSTHCGAWQTVCISAFGACPCHSYCL